MEALVVGGGIVGLAVADELLRRGAAVTLLERNPAVGAEASGAAAGILTPQGDVPGPGPLLDLLIKAYPLIEETIPRVERLSGVPVGYSRSGLLSIAQSGSDEEDLTQQVLWQERAGIPLERLDSAQVRAMEPAVDGAVRWGVWCSQSAQVDPPRLVQAYRMAVEKQGGRIHLESEVRRFVVERSRVIGVETTSGQRFYADWTVNCAGCWAGLDPHLPAAIPSLPVRGQMIQFSTSRPWVRRVVKSPKAYLVQRSPARLVAGSTVEYVGLNKQVTEEGCRKIREGAIGISSQVESLPLEAAWAGLRPDTPDHLPIMGLTPVDRLLVATGHFRNGILLAPWTGRMIADWVTGHPPTRDLTPFSLSRFLVK